MSAAPTSNSPTLAHRVLLGLVALCVLLVSLPDKRRLVCLLRTGSTSCCCATADPATPHSGSVQSDGAASCCQRGDHGIDDEGDGASRSPCNCGDDLPAAPPASDDAANDLKPDTSAWIACAAAAPRVAWPEPAPARGVAHEVPPRPTGPPLFVLFEAFLI